MRHKRLILLLLGVVVIFLIFFFVVKPNKTSTKEIVIGAIMPLTGDVAQYGQNCRKGIELALDEINLSGGIKGKKLKVIFEDDKASPKDAVSAFNKLVSVNKVECVLGPLPSSCAMATVAIANSYKVVSFSPGASTPKLSNAGKYIFRNWQSDTLEAEVMTNYSLKNGWKKIAIFYINNDFGKALSDYFIKAFENKGGKICSIESFGQNATDFRAQLTKIKSINPDAIYLLSYPQETPIIINQSIELGLKTQFLGVAAFEDPSLIKIAGKNAEGVLYTHAIPPDVQDPVYSKFVKTYKEKYGEDPGLISDTGYDALLMLAHSLKLIPSEPYTGTKISDYLSQIRDFQGASGKMSFDNNHDVIKPVGIKTVRKGEFVWLEK